jgi:ATP-binding cassette, subfamily B, bacterial
MKPARVPTAAPTPVTPTPVTPTPATQVPARPTRIPLRTALRLCLLAGRAQFAWHLTLVLLQGIIPLLGLYAMQWLVDAVAIGMRSGVPGDAAYTALWRATGLAAAVAVLGNIVRGLAAVTSENHARELGDRCAQQLQEHVARLDLAEFDRPAFHDLLHKAGAEAGQRPVRLVQDLAGFGTALVSLVAMSFVLALVQPWLPLLVAVAAAPIAVMRTRHARLRFQWQEQNVREQREVGYLGAVLTGRATAKDLRALRLGRTFASRLAALRQSLRTTLHGLAVRRARADLWVHTLASLAMFGAYVYLGHQALLGVLSIGGLVLHAQAVQRAQNGLRDVLSAGAAIGEDRLFLRPFVDLLAMEPGLGAKSSVVDSPIDFPDRPPIPAPIRAPGLRAHGVGFHYPMADVPALRDVEFAIAPGERIAIVGGNGSGKSTLVKLLCRLYDPTTGTLSANDVDLRQMAADAWQTRVSVLFQDANAFELTLRENLLLGGGTEPDEARLWSALAAVSLEARVRALPLGLDTPLSRRLPGGVEFSGGELRRLLLARTLAQPAAVLLLDEPFAQLDGMVAEQVAADLRNRPRDQTIVLVDHRSAAVRCVDRVIVLEAGKLTAIGTPAELRAGDARFRALFQDS